MYKEISESEKRRRQHVKDTYKGKYNYKWMIRNRGCSCDCSTCMDMGDCKNCEANDRFD